MRIQINTASLLTELLRGYNVNPELVKQSKELHLDNHY